MSTRRSSPSMSGNIGPHADLDTVGGLAQALKAAVEASGRPAQLALIRAHPDLADRARLSEESVSEQAGAGLDNCSARRTGRISIAERRLQGAVRLSLHQGGARLLAARYPRTNSAAAPTTIRTPNSGPPWTRSTRSRGSAGRSGLGGAWKILRRPGWTWHNPRLGSKVVYATDDFFADKARLIDPAEPVFIPGKYDAHGKWMDGWESRRKRIAGPRPLRREARQARHRARHRDRHPQLHRQLPAGGVDRRGAAPTQRIAGRRLAGSLVPPTPLKGDDRLFLPIAGIGPVTHVQLNIFPDGGVARLRVYGQVRADWKKGERGRSRRRWRTAPCPSRRTTSTSAASPTCSRRARR